MSKNDTWHRTVVEIAYEFLGFKPSYDSGTIHAYFGGSRKSKLIIAHHTFSTKLVGGRFKEIAIFSRADLRMHYHNGTLRHFIEMELAARKLAGDI